MKSPIRSLANVLRGAPAYVAPNTPAGLPWGWNGVSSTGQLAAYGNVSTLFSIVSRLAMSVSEVEWKLWRPARGDGERTEVTVHPALSVWNAPNKHFTRQRLVETGQQHNDLTGETWLVVARMLGRPVELWPVRPDRIEPVPSTVDFLAGYIYHAPGGERVPLGIDEVLPILWPDPMNPYRGLGPVQSMLIDLEASRDAAEWNRNFFRNNAAPGGVIQVANRLSDDDFKRLQQQWGQNHRGVSNAHRVGILESGATFQAATYSQRDMQFTELRSMSRDVIREGYGIQKFVLGDVEDVNRATADAARTSFAENQTVPRLERWKQMLNARFLPLFGPNSQRLEFDYVSPVPEDTERDNAERDSKTAAWAALVTAGADPLMASAVVGLPPIPLRPQEVTAA